MVEYLKQLDENTHHLLAVIDELSVDKVVEHNGSGWSVLEILEHIYLTDKAICQVVSKEANTSSQVKEIVGQAQLKRILVTERNSKIEAPDMLKPKGDFQSIADFKTAFLQLRNTLKSDMSTERLKVDNRVHRHFILGEMTIADWLNFILFHTDRHIKQIEELKQ